MGCRPSKPNATSQTDFSSQLQYHDPVQYESSKAEIREQTRLVQYLHFVASTVLATGGNHWIMFLQTGVNQSVRIAMDPGDILGAPSPGHGFRGQMNITLLDYAIPADAHHIVTVSMSGQHSVADFIDAIIAAGNDEYDFTTEGRGCTGWMIDQYHLFLRHGMVKPEARLESEIAQAWVENRAIGPQGTTRGFYMRNTRGGGWSKKAGSRRS